MKITDEELQTVRDNRSTVEFFASELSDYNIRMVVLSDLIKESEIHFLEAMKIEERFLTELNEKYGKGLLNTETGELEINNGE